MTTEEINFSGNYTHSAVDLHAGIKASHRGMRGPFDWLEAFLLSDGAAALRVMQEGKTAAPKIVLWPQAQSHPLEEES
jgi:L-iditol 2-dehydrogenase